MNTTTQPTSMNRPRYVIHDDDGPLRAFWTLAEAQAWQQPGMHLKVLPRPRRQKIDLSQLGEALL